MPAYNVNTHAMHYAAAVKAVRRAKLAARRAQMRADRIREHARHARGRGARGERLAATQGLEPGDVTAIKPGMSAPATSGRALPPVQHRCNRSEA